MALAIKDRVKEFSTTTGTGTLTLAGTTTGFRTFASALANGDTTYYAIQGGADWEVGVGTYSAGTLARTTVLSSSNADAAVNFSAGTKDVFITMPANKVVNTDTGLPTTGVILSTSGSPSDTNTLQDFIRHSWSTGMTQPGALTPNAGAGTITIAANDFVTRQGTGEDSPLVVYRDAGATNLAIAANDVSYVYRDYNSGSPTWTTGTSLSSFNGVDKVICYVVARNGTRMNIVDVSGVNVDGSRKNRRQKVEFDGFVYNGYWRSSLGKSSLSASGLNILVGAGKYFYFDNPITHAAFDTTVAGAADANNFITFYNRTGTWTQITGQKAINNTQYDNAGTLTAFGGGASHFRADWVYVVLGSTSPYLAVVMGNVDYTSLAAAQAAPQPSTLPPQFDGMGVLVGQVVAQKAVGTLTVQVAGTASFSGAAASSSHATLSSLDWPGSGHTSTAGKLAGFDGTTGVAVDITVGSGLSLSGNTLTSSGGSSALVIDSKVAAYTVVAGDLGKIINCSGGAYTVSLTSAVTLGSGFNCTIWNSSSTVAHIITIDPSGVETLDGKTTLLLQRGEGVEIISDGTVWQTGDKKAMRLYADNATPAEDRPSATGNAAVAIGRLSVASGTSAASMGSGCTASGNSSVVLGSNGIASGDYSTAIGSNSNAEGARAVGIGAIALGGSYALGTDSFAAGIANNTSTYGALGANSIAIGFRAKATAANTTAIGYTALADTSRSTAIGYAAKVQANDGTAIGSNSAQGGSNSQGAGSIALSGSYASGIDSFAAAIANNTSTYGAQVGNSIAIGNLAKASGSGYAIAIGLLTRSSGIGSVAIGGYTTGPIASGTNSVALGDCAKAAEYGKYAYSGVKIAASGDTQAGVIVVVSSTTNATPVVLTSDAGAASTTNQLILANNQAMVVTGQVIGRQQVAGADKATAWTFSAVIRRGANAASTALVAAVTPVLVAQDVSLATSAISVTADTTNGGLAVTVTGIAATNMRWVATLNSTEVTYA